MTREALALSVRSLVAEHLMVGLAEVTDGARFMEDLGADSLDFVELAMAAEEEWDIEVPDEDVYPLLTVKDAIDYLARRLVVAEVA